MSALSKREIHFASPKYLFPLIIFSIIFIIFRGSLGNGFVEWDEKNTVWYVSNKGKKEETINRAIIIEMYVNGGALNEIKYHE